jgi:isoleucyl-tRNA synthetase
MLYEAEKYSKSSQKSYAESSYLPGWDCHGLPIEQKALKAIGVGLVLGSELMG